MATIRRVRAEDPLSTLDGLDNRRLTSSEEHELLAALADSKRRIAGLLGRDVRNAIAPNRSVQDSQSSPMPKGKAEGRFTAAFRRYNEIRSQIALGNVRLVAHVAKRYRDHGLSHADLIQEGFCGLLEAIDRFEVDRETKLSTYAIWWIRQAMQQAVATGAYAVRLNPRHLRMLAQNQGMLDATGSAIDSGLAPDGELRSSTPSPEIILRILTATRPADSIEANSYGRSGSSLIHQLSTPGADPSLDRDIDDTLARLFRHLQDREKEVLSLRFGLVGKPEMSLSQVGRLLRISKERVRQIQTRAFEKLRNAPEEKAARELLFA